MDLCDLAGRDDEEKAFGNPRKGSAWREDFVGGHVDQLLPVLVSQTRTEPGVKFARPSPNAAVAIRSPLGENLIPYTLLSCRRGPKSLCPLVML